MIQQHKSIISNNKIVIYLQYNLLFLSISLLILFEVLALATFIFISIQTGKTDLVRILFYMIFCAIMCSPFYIASKLKIIINLDTNQVIKDYLLFKRKLTTLDKIERVADIESPYGLYFSLVKKDNKFGKGYRITNYFKVPAHNSQLSDFIHNVLPLIEEKLTPEQKEETLTEYKFYTTCAPKLYKVRPRHKFYQYLMLLVFGGFLIWNIFFSDVKMDWIWFLLLPTGIYVYAISSRRYFDLNENCLISATLWGLYKRKYYFKNFTNYVIEHNGKSPTAEGTVLYMKFLSEKGEKRVVLRDFGKSKNVERFMAETKMLLGN